MLIYAMVAILALALPVRVWLQDRSDPVHSAFVLLGLNLALVYMSFTAYLATAEPLLNRAYVAGAAFVPVTLHGFLGALFRDGRPTHRWLWLLSATMALGYLIAEQLLYQHVVRASPAAVTVATWVLGVGGGVGMVRLAREHAANASRVERARIRYLLVLLGGAFLFSFVEALARALTLPTQDSPLTPALLQGAIPPVGVLFTGVLFYFLHQVLVLSRLLDIHEIFSRIMTLALLGTALALVLGIAVLWNQSLTVHPVHATYMMVVAIVLFLAAYDPLRQAVERWVDNWFNRRGQLLALTLREVDRAMTRAMSTQALFSSILDPLVTSGRIPYAAIYLWDEDTGQFRLAAARGSCVPAPLPAVPPVTLAGGDAPRPDVLALEDLQRTASINQDDATAQGVTARLMEAMGLDLILPLMADELLLGWIGVQDEPWSDGFSQEETARLRVTADKMAVVLENIHGFERLKESHRLAGLGTMAAGLAHEIRNPLAGIKGAAQYLAGAPTEDDMREFLDVMVTEVDRLNKVVTQFLDYARPMDVAQDPVDMNHLVLRCLQLVGGEELPKDVELVADLEPDIPRATGDPSMISQVILNLVRNGLEAMAGEGRLVVSTRRGGGLKRQPATPTVELLVEDTGEGIEPEAMEKLFIPFFTTRQGGTGLGLSICRRIAEAHGGELDASSTPGAGSRFTLRLPAKSALLAASSF